MIISDDSHHSKVIIMRIRVVIVKVKIYFRNRENFPEVISTAGALVVITV